MSDVVFIQQIEFIALIVSVVGLVIFIVLTGIVLLKNQPARVLFFNGLTGKLTAFFIYANRRMQAITLKKSISGWHDQKDLGIFATSANAAILPTGTPPIFILREDLALAIDVKEVKPQKGKYSFRKVKPASIRVKGHIIDLNGLPIEAGAINVNPIRIQSLIAKFVDVAVKKVNDYWTKRVQGGAVSGGGMGSFLIGMLVGAMAGAMFMLMMGGGEIVIPQILPSDIIPTG